MRVLFAICGLLVASAASGAAQVDPDTLDLKKIFDAKDSVAGVPLVDSLPQIINCPRFDPERVRGDATTFSFERRPEAEVRSGLVEFTLEFVVGKDGKVERGRTRVMRSNNSALEQSFEYWVQTCAFKPGKIGDNAVRVRMQHEWSYTVSR